MALGSLSNHKQCNKQAILFIFSCSLNNVGYLPLIIVPATIAQGALHAPGTNIAIELKRGVSRPAQGRAAP